MPYAALSMALYQHELFTIDLNKVVAVHQDDDEVTIIIRTEDQRKIEVATESPEAALELLNDLASKWVSAGGFLMRHAKHVFLASAIYSIQVAGEEVYIYFRDHSVSFTLPDQLQALQLLSELTRRWQSAIGEESAA